MQKLKVRVEGRGSSTRGRPGYDQAPGKAALGEAKFCYVTALTDPQIRALLAKKRLQLELFDEKPAEVELNKKRYVLRCNPQTQTRERARRGPMGACTSQDHGTQSGGGEKAQNRSQKFA